jgi:hypothetical protein
MKILSFTPLMGFLDLRFHKSDDVACPTRGVNQNSLTLITGDKITES